jgi:hypothetical protein
MRRRFLLLLLPLAILARPSTASAQAPGLVFDRLISCRMCDGPEAFREIQSVYVADGRVAATDADEPHVRVFPLSRAAGDAVRTLGPEGDGPGELRAPLTAVLHADQSVTVVDVSQKRITEFGSSDEVLSTRRINAFPAGAGYATEARRLLFTITDFKGGLTLVRPVGEARLDTVLARVPFQDDGVMRFVAPAVRSDGAFAFGEGSEEYLIDVYTASGRLERALRRDVERRPRTAEEMAVLRDRVTLAGGGRRRAGSGGAAREIEVDPRQPHFGRLSSLQFDGNDRLWVRTSRAPAGRTVFDVFGADLHYLGEVAVERQLGVYSVRDGWLAGVTEDDLGTPGVAVWRVVEPGG